MPTPSTYGQFRARLLLGFSLLIALLLTLLSWHVYTEYQNDQRQAVAETKILADAMSAHVLSVIQTADLSLKASAAALMTLNPDAMPPSAEIKKLLAQAERTPDTNFWIIFLDRDGKGLAASNGLKVEGVSYADRSYFAEVAKSAGGGLFVGGPEIGRTSGRRLFFLSRRVESPSGRFLGVVATPMDASAVAGVFANSLSERGLSIMLLHSNGKIVARAPKFEESFGATIRGNLTAQTQTAPSSSFEAISPVDGVLRIFSFSKVDKLPLQIFVGMASEVWTRGVKDDLIAAVGGLAVILAVMTFSGKFALRSYLRLEKSELRQRKLIDELRIARDEIGRGEKRIRIITDNVPALISYIDTEQRYVFHNSHYRFIKEAGPSALVGKTIRAALGERIHEAIKGELARALLGERVSFERALESGGRMRHLKFEYMPDVDDQGNVIGLFGLVTDVSDMKRIQEKLIQIAHFDALTGLPNRSNLYERLREAIARASRSESTLCCLYLDIDHFKNVNDTLGHAAGDSLLKQFGERLQACVRLTDMVARLAGDEFVIVLEGLGQPSGAQAVVAKIIDAMRVPFVLEGQSRVITTSVGAVIAHTHSPSDDATSPDALLKKADSALYAAKRSGRDGFAFYES